ncbi:MAG: zinc ribbon domain-containing protein [Clostridium sp.]|nr:zinc ribbon domain-containing protein [Clostridium sp.]
MYTEFIIIYILLLIVIALLVAVLVVTLKASKNRNDSSSNFNVNFSSASPVQQEHKAVDVQSNVGFNTNVKTSTEAPQNVGVVFCTKCAKQYSANEKFCPNCGTPRN